METTSPPTEYDSITFQDCSKTGHLLVTGFYDCDPPGTQRLYIHVSEKLTGRYICNVYSHYTGNPNIVSWRSHQSPDYTTKEHGWFHDIRSFSAICEAHPIPSGSTQESIFIDWRDSLLVFLNTNYGPEQWVPVKQYT